MGDRTASSASMRTQLGHYSSVAAKGLGPRGIFLGTSAAIRMDIPAWCGLSDASHDRGKRSRRDSALHLLYRLVYRTDPGLGRTSFTPVLRDIEPGSHGRVDALSPYPSRPFERILAVATG